MAITFFSLGEKGPIIWQSRFTLVLLQVVFYVNARLRRSRVCIGIDTAITTVNHDLIQQDLIFTKRFQ